MFLCLMVYDIGRADLTGVDPIFVVVLLAIVIVLLMALIWLAKPLFADQGF